MDCSQILPGAVNSGPCSLSTGYYNEHPFIVYASGRDVVILDGRLKHVQTLLGSDLGYGETSITCVHCAELVGKVAVTWGSDVVIFHPELLEDNQLQNSNEFPGHWVLSHTLPLDYPVLSVSWNKEGRKLLVGGDIVSLWVHSQEEGVTSLLPPDPNLSGEGSDGVWGELWRCPLAQPAIHLSFSPDGAMFATASQDDHFVKIWYHSRIGGGGLGTTHMFSFVYVAHPMRVTGMAWRKTSSFMPKGCVPNVLLTYCHDNICRMWSHSVAQDTSTHLRFFIAASIDPVADIPFKSMAPIEGMPFLVHWLQNKETTFTSKAEKTQKGSFLPLSRHSSLASFASSINEEMLQSWVCIEDTLPSPDQTSSRLPHVFPLENYLRSGPRGGGGEGMLLGSPQRQPDSTTARASLAKKLFAGLMDEWCNSPDLLLCIHPGTGSLMVWTVEGLDAAHSTSRLCHVSFSSCLPHIFPPHLAQSLHSDLLQYLIKEPDVVHTREMALTGSLADISIPVPQIRLPSGGTVSGAMANARGRKEDMPKTKADSSLILISNHQNGSIHAWSVELTVQSNYYTSIAGLIHWGGTGGHHLEVRAVHRHPWLPVLMTVSIENDEIAEKEKENGKRHVDNELIIWNAHLPGPLEHKSGLHELSRMSSPDPLSFLFVTWVPPISVSSSAKEGFLARSPSSGLFVANVGTELRLFQTSLYCTSKSPAKGELGSSFDGSQPDIFITSHFGKEGIRSVSVIERDISQFEDIVSLHAFRLCSLVTSHDIKKSLNAKFSKDVVIALIENRSSEHPTPKPASDSLSSSATAKQSYLHLWRVVISTHQPASSEPLRQGDTLDRQFSVGVGDLPYKAQVEKVLCCALPLPHKVHVERSLPACDISSSLQLQLPTLSAPFLLTTICSDATLHCWQLTARCATDSITVAARSVANPKTTLGVGSEAARSRVLDYLEFELNEVYVGSSACSTGDGTTHRGSCGLDLKEAPAVSELPKESDIPCSIANAYAGRLALAHLLTHAPESPLSPRRPSVNPLGRYSAVTIWECESTGGLNWLCEETLFLSGVGGISHDSKSSTQVDTVHLEWLPMENGAYLLATCFESIISVFGMALPQVEGDFAKLVTTRSNKFLAKKASSNLLVTDSSKVSWVCLLQFPCAKRYPGLSISQFAYTGSNSLLISIGTEIHIYSCMVRGGRLEAFTPSQKERKAISKTPSRVFRQRESLEGSGKLNDSDIINLLDFAHARNTPLPQYHPKILLELMNSGKLHAVRAILVNLVKYLLLYESRHTSSEEEEEEREMSFNYSSSDRDKTASKRKRMLSVSSDGQLRRSHRASSKMEVETIPSLSLSKLGIFGTSFSATQEQESTHRDQTERGTEDSMEGLDEDDMFTLTTELATPKEEDFSFTFNEHGKKEMSFSDINPLTSDLTPEMSAKLSSILRYAQLADLSDLEQVRLMAIAETVANTRMAFDRQPTYVVAAGGVSMPTSDSAPMLGFTAGAGYASTSLAQGVGGGEAMDDCGIRYLLALKNYISLSESLPSGVRPGRLSPSDFIWAFHSDAEMELLAALPCVQRDNLRWPELRNAGVGWWLRSLDTLRRLTEKLAKTQFMAKQDPLDASLFYLAMKKKSLLKGLFRTVGDSRMTKFFGENFTTERWKKAALKNAFSLLSKQRFEHAAAFFLLGGKLWDACEVCISRMGDLQLALVITRLYEGDGGPVYEKILKETVLGMGGVGQRNGTGVNGGGKQVYVGESNPDPFLRSIACWLLQDYSTALETLLWSEHAANGDVENPSRSLDPAIFNFYFFLRSQPLLIRRNQQDYRSLGKKSRSLLPSSVLPRDSSSRRKHLLSSVGDEPLTALERKLLFSTAYHHLNHGCPLLALDVLAKLPKSSSLGADLNQVQRQWSDSTRDILQAEEAKSGRKKLKPVDPTASLTGMIQSGTLREFDYAPKTRGFHTDGVAEEQEVDWAQPVTSSRGGEAVGDTDWSKPVGLAGGSREEEEEIDWSKPITAQMLTGNGDGHTDQGGDDIDWSQPVSSQFEAKPRSPSLSPPNFDGRGTFSPPSDSALLEGSDESERSSSHPSSRTTLSSQGLFVLSLAEQLQYNACLSILTEELITIHLPLCCDFLWEKGGRGELPLLPRAKRQEERQLASYSWENAFEKTVLNLRGLLVVWLRREMSIVKEICGFDSSQEDLEESSEDYVPAGYDLLTTLMNYASLHAGTSPSLVTIKLELMHLMNTLLPWSTQPTRAEAGLEVEAAATVASPLGGALPTCAVDPSQLPILTSCSLPAKHLTNLALHLRLMSASIVEVLANHTCPPIASKPLPHVDKVFELCCAISNSITVCLSPINISEIAPDLLLSPTNLAANVGNMSGIATPITAGVGNFSQSIEPRQKERSPKVPQRTTAHRSGRSSSFVANEPFEPPTSPNTKASKWPGVSKWPKALQSDEGKDPTPMSLILAECCIAVYVGLLSVAWSRHSIGDLLLLLKNCPSQQFWYLAFGGGVDMKRSEEKGQKGGGGGGERSAFMKKVDTMKKGLKMLRKVASQSGESPGHGLFVAPRKTLLELFLDGTVDDRSGSEQGITFTTQRTLSNASTISPDAVEDEEEYFVQEMEEGPSFRLGSLSKEDDVRDPQNPDSFPWCLINLCITKTVQEGVRKILNTAGLEVLELVTASPLLYSTLKVLDEWESIFTRRLDALETLPEDLFTKEDEEAGTMFVGVGPAVMRHKFILEPENSPFRGQTAVAKEARQLWEFLVHMDECREVFIHHIFASRGVSEGSGVNSGPSCRSLFKAVDSVVWSFCIHPAAQWNPTIMAMALHREIIEIEIPDTAGLDSVPYGDEVGEAMSIGPGGTIPKRSQSVAFTGAGDFILVQATPYLRSPASSSSSSSGESSAFRRYSSLAGLHSQTGANSSILLRRSVVGVKKIVPHPSMAYYLTGSMDGSVRMWEFGTQRVVSQQRSPGTPSITQIRFTPQGNKYGVTDTSGKLHLWQGIHTSTKTPYKVLDSGMRQLSDFLFLGSSSLIVAGGDAQDNKNLIIWDTLLPNKRNVVKEYVCHEVGGASVLAYSQLKQRIFSGGKRGEVCIFDIRQNALIQYLTVHSSAITCMVVNDVEGYLVTGSSEGDIKVLDLTSMDELAVYVTQHAKSRLFRQDGGVTDLCVKPGGVLFSSGADGSIRSRTLP